MRRKFIVAVNLITGVGENRFVGGKILKRTFNSWHQALTFLYDDIPNENVLSVNIKTVFER